MSDLRERVPGQSLIDELLRQWDAGTIHIDGATNGVVIGEDAEGWYRGVLGERRIAALLATLGPEWTVLHSVPVGRGSSDIDHVVIGPPGVFTINTKFSPGKTVWVGGYGLLVDGVKTRYVANALLEARRASTNLTKASGLTVAARGLIVFVEPARITEKAQPGGGEADPTIEVLSDDELLDELNRAREYSDEQIARIVDAAARPATWSDAVVASSDGAHVAREFEALELEVGPRLSMQRGVARDDASHGALVGGRGAGAMVRSRPSSYSAPRGGQRSPRSGRSSRGRSRRSLPERPILEFALPISGLVALWVWSQSFAGQ